MTAKATADSQNCRITLYIVGWIITKYAFYIINMYHSIALCSQYSKPSSVSVNIYRVNRITCIGLTVCLNIS